MYCGIDLKSNDELECGPMPNVIAALPNIGGALCKSSIIPFLVPRHKVWWCPLLECHAVTLPIQANTRLGHKVNFARGKIPLGARSPKNVCSVAAQETYKVWLASGEWRRCSNEANTWNPLKCAEVPQTGKPISVVSGPTFAILWGRGWDIAVWQLLFWLSMRALVAKIQPNKVVWWCADGIFSVIFASCISSKLRAAHFKPAF